MKDLSQMSHRRIRCTIRITQKDVVKGHSFSPSACQVSACKSSTNSTCARMHNPPQQFTILKARKHLLAVPLWGQGPIKPTSPIHILPRLPLRHSPNSTHVSARHRLPFGRIKPNRNPQFLHHLNLILITIIQIRIIHLIIIIVITSVILLLLLLFRDFIDGIRHRSLLSGMAVPLARRFRRFRSVAV